MTDAGPPGGAVVPVATVARPDEGGDVWIPRDAAEVVAAAASGDLRETSTFDGKRELPAAGKSVDVVIDIAAMNTAGGVLLYGLGEDEQERLTRPQPFELAGEPERIDRVRLTAISEPPDVDIRRWSWTKPGYGFIVVVVPASPRAPHMVTVGGKNRFYGRGETGNRVLTEADIAAFYAQRDRWEIDASALLTQAVADAPIEPHDDFPYMHVVLQPFTAPADLLRRAAGDEEGKWVSSQVTEAGSPAVWTRRVMDFAYSRRVPSPDGWELASGLDDAIEMCADSS